MEKKTENISELIIQRFHQLTQVYDTQFASYHKEMRELRKEMNEKHAELVQMVKVLKEENKPILEMFKNLTFMQRMVIWLATFLGSIIGAIIAFKEIIKYFAR